jgi:endonuclease/exonuclease/phosphatase family metal-dependent hydrolase
MLVRWLGVCSLAVPSLHCGDDSVDVREPVRDLALVSFNSALGVGLAPYKDQRLEAIEADLPGLGADLVCLQEVWEAESVDRLASALAREYPYSHRSVRLTGGGGAACSQTEAVLLQSCLDDNCGDVEPEGLPLCAIANCAASFTEVSMPCQQCIAANQSATDVENLASLCSADGGEAAAYADQTGLLILSRLPLEETSYFAFESALGDRGLLSARVHTDFMGDVDVHCTHLAASLAEVPYTGPYGSWQGERLRQIEQMLERVSAIGSDDNATILLGDMNCGPSTPLAESASPDAFARLSAGFSAPYTELDGRCTFCRNNPLNGSVVGPEEGALIDHVLVSAPGNESYTATRVFDGGITVEADGTAIDTAHSDHYGIRVVASGAGAGGAAP